MTRPSVTRPSVTRDALLPLTFSVAALQAPCRRNAAEAEICAEVDAWAKGLGAKEGARFGEMAGRAFPETDAASVVLFGQWLVWLFAFDDVRDEGPVGRDEQATDRLYEAVLNHGVHPIAQAFQDLWGRTAVRATRGWRAAFWDHLDQHRAACRSEARFRRLGRPPTIHEYAELRRKANGPFMFDLAEPILDVRIPDGVRESEPWQTMLAACNDVTAWCNDIASAAKEQAAGDVHNYVLVLTHHTDADLDEAVRQVSAKIAGRIRDLERAAARLPRVFKMHDLSPQQARDVSKVAVTLLGAPRGHLEWLLESDRYDESRHDERRYDERRYDTDSAMRSASSLVAMPSSR